jgi:asparagine synthase (glutamine-hydrolysing)
VVFASELRALLAADLVTRDIDPTAVHDFLSFMYVPAPRTIYKDVCKLPPASIIEFTCSESEDDPPTPQVYWRPSFLPKLDIAYADAVTETRRLLDSAVEKRLQSEVPLGAFLSGGIDSSAIAGLMQKRLDQPVQTFTIGFDDQRYDEREFARIAAQAIGSQHRERTAEPQDIKLLRTMIRNHGEPYADSSMIPTALLSRFTREHVTVALSGDGADEVFGGYLRYQVMGASPYVQAMPRGLRSGAFAALLKMLPEQKAQRTRLSTIRRLLTIYSNNDTDAYGTIQQVFSDDAKQSLCGDAGSIQSSLHYFESIVSPYADCDDFEQYMALDMLSYLPGDILPKVDIASMAFSLEARSPFLDHELVDFVCQLPRDYKVDLKRRKKLLIDAAEDVLPPTIQQRGKRGFGVPISEWLRGDLQPMLRGMLHDSSWNVNGIFSMSVLRNMVDAHVSGAADYGNQLWVLLCYKLWVEEVHQAVADG